MWFSDGESQRGNRNLDKGYPQKPTAQENKLIPHRTAETMQC
jgi:hypothetical protein